MSDSVELPVLKNGRKVSHLCVWLTRPDNAPQSQHCVLFLHGFASDQLGPRAEFFRDRFLSAGMAFCSFDFQGHGQSGGSMRELSLTRNLNDIGSVHAYLKSIGYKDLVITGSSMGGLAGLWFAARQPEVIRAGIYIAPALNMDIIALRRIGEASARDWQRTGLLCFDYQERPCELNWDFIVDHRDYPLDQLIAQQRIPSLIFQGKNDDTVDWQTVEMFAGACKSSTVELHLFEDGDHGLMDYLNEVWKASELFLRRFEAL